MNFRFKFRHRRSIRRPRFPVRVQNFGDLATFFVDFCILYYECPPYFYFRFVWPTDLESIPHASYCSRSRRRRFTVLDFKSWVYSRIYGHFQQHLHCAWTSGVNLDTAVRFADPEFLLECKISAIWRRFPLIFAFYMPNVRHISTSVCLTYWPRKYTTRANPHVDNSHQVWSWYDHPLPSYSVFV